MACSYHYSSSEYSFKYRLVFVHIFSLDHCVLTHYCNTLLVCFLFFLFLVTYSAFSYYYISILVNEKSSACEVPPTPNYCVFKVSSVDFYDSSECATKTLRWLSTTVQACAKPGSPAMKHLAPCSLPSWVALATTA